MTEDFSLRSRVSTRFPKLAHCARPITLNHNPGLQSWDLTTDSWPLTTDSWDLAADSWPLTTDSWALTTPLQATRPAQARITLFLGLGPGLQTIGAYRLRGHHSYTDQAQLKRCQLRSQRRPTQGKLLEGSCAQLLATQSQNQSVHCRGTRNCDAVVATGPDALQHLSIHHSYTPGLVHVYPLYYQIGQRTYELSGQHRTSQATQSQQNLFVSLQEGQQLVGKHGAGMPAPTKGNRSTKGFCRTGGGWTNDSNFVAVPVGKALLPTLYPIFAGKHQPIVMGQGPWHNKIYRHRFNQRHIEQLQALPGHFLRKRIFTLSKRKSANHCCSFCFRFCVSCHACTNTIQRFFMRL